MSESPLTVEDRDFPSQLTHLSEPVESLYYRGNSQLLREPLISIVGSRKMTGYGERVAEHFLPQLVRSGLAVVSGLAYGVDSYVHRLTLRLGGRCVVVLAHGLDRIYPACHYGLAEEIVQAGGCLLTEYAWGVAPKTYHFCLRNRIIAALSPVVLIIEAGDPSGTLITARYAKTVGREVCVVPGDFDREQSLGCHRILKEAEQLVHLVTSPEEVLAYYREVCTVTAESPLRPALTGTPALLYDLLSCGSSSVNALVRQSGLSTPQVQSVLAILELDGYIHNHQGEWSQVHRSSST